MKKARKPIISVNNKLKGSFGETTMKKGKAVKVEINVKRHKGNRAELADTIKHEMWHVKHPKATEKATYKAVPKKLSRAEQDRAIAKLKLKTLNYEAGVIKRKARVGEGATQPGELINRAKAISAERAGIMALI